LQTKNSESWDATQSIPNSGMRYEQFFGSISSPLKRIVIGLNAALESTCTCAGDGRVLVLSLINVDIQLSKIYISQKKKKKKKKNRIEKKRKAIK
jgi:hypothetical protein